MNELLLIASLAVQFSTVLLMYSLFGDRGLYAFSAIATVLCNIEVLILIEAFGTEMTLGNILFASTFLITDILSETRGREAANMCVKIGIASSLLFVLLTASWLKYIPSSGDWVLPHITAVFSHTPRIVAVSLAVYTAVQFFDVFFYHKIWNYTTKRFHSKERFLWLRNNLGTITSQLINAILFNLGAFWGMYDSSTIKELIISTFLIYIVTSLADTPFIYLARRIYTRKKALPASLE